MEFHSTPPNGPKLVFISSSFAEIPAEWIAEKGAPVYSFEELKDNREKLINKSGPNSGVLFAVTGPEPSTAAQAAEWIAVNIKPLYAVDIGAAADTGAGLNEGSWMTPCPLHSAAGDGLYIDTRLPFRWQERLNRVIKTAQADDDGGKNYSFLSSLKMARVFEKTGTPFHIVKRIVPKLLEGEAGMDQALSQMRNELKDILSFLNGPGEPNISAVIPSYNRADRIAKSVESVLSQTLPPKELIVVDDGSSDNTLKVLEKFSGKIKIVALPENRGLSAARNEGVKAATGEWIAFNDSDDFWKPEKLEIQWRHIQANPYIQFVHTYEDWVYDGKKMELATTGRKPAGWAWEASVEHPYIAPQTSMITKSLYTELGGFDESMRVCEDHEFWIRLTRLNPVGLCQESLAVYNGGHPDQLSKRSGDLLPFRLLALAKAWSNETDPQYRIRLEKEIGKKMDQSKDNYIFSADEPGLNKICESLLSSSAYEAESILKHFGMSPKTPDR